MTFEIDFSTKKIADLERGIELKAIGGGSGGMMIFNLVKGSEKIQFTGRTHFRPNPDFDPADLATKNILIWDVSVAPYGLADMSIGETREAIRESLKVFRGSNGIPVNQKTEVSLPIWEDSI